MSGISQSKRTVAAIIGTVIEWAEYSFYAYMAHMISDLFFPEFDKTAALIATYGVFAAGFLIRPLGAVFFGYIGDRIGRKSALVGSVYLMAFATIGMGLLPTYAQIGIAAPALLLLFRLLQGFAVAGEFNGASIFLIEHSKNERPCLAGCWSAFGAAAGMMLGGVAASIVSLPDMPDWAWRVPFMLGFVGCIVGVYIRKNFDETPAFDQVKTEQLIEKLPLLTAIKQHKKALLQTAIMAGFIGANVYICNVYFISFLIHEGQVKSDLAIRLVTFGEACVVLMLPFMAMLADKFGVKPLLKIGFTLAIVGAPTLFYFGSTGIVGLIIIGQILYATWDTMVSGALFKYVFDLFPTNVKYSGYTFAWCVSVALFGGTAPMMAQYWVGENGWTLAPALYVALFAAMGLGVVFAKKKLANTNKLSTSAASQ